MCSRTYHRVGARSHSFCGAATIGRHSGFMYYFATTPCQCLFRYTWQFNCEYMVITLLLKSIVYVTIRYILSENVIPSHTRPSARIPNFLKEQYSTGWSSAIIISAELDMVLVAVTSCKSQRNYSNNINTTHALSNSIKLD